MTKETVFKSKKYKISKCRINQYVKISASYNNINNDNVKYSVRF